MGSENLEGLPPEEQKKLLDEYMQALPAQLNEITHAIEELSRQKTKESLEALRFLVHRLAGNAGTFGFSSVTEWCRNWEQELVGWIAQFDGNAVDESKIHLLQEKLKEVQKRFEH